MDNLLMPGQAQGAPMGAPMGAQQPMSAEPVDPQHLADARAHLGIMTKGLMDLAAKPKGSLSKRDLFNASAEMIAQGAFGTPDAKQQLIAQLSQIPDDEGAIRKAVGEHLLWLAHAQDRIHHHFGAE